MTEQPERMTMLEKARTQTRWFLGAMAVILVVGIGLGLGTGNVDCSGQSPMPQDTFESRSKEVLASVGADTVTWGEYNRAWNGELERTRANNPPGTLINPLQEWQIKTSALAQLLYSRLLRQQALEHGITPDPEEIKTRMAADESQFLGPTSRRAERNILHVISDGLEGRKRDRQFNSYLQQYVGMTQAEYQERVELELLQQKYVDQLRSTAEGTVKTTALDKIKGFKADAEGGANFEELVKANSEDVAGRNSGGHVTDLVMERAKAVYGQEYVDALRNTPVGAFSPPIYFEPPQGLPPGQTGDLPATTGYFLVQVESFRRAEGPEFEAAKEGLRQEILAEKEEQLKQDPKTTVAATEEEIVMHFEQATLRQLFIAIPSPDEQLDKDFKAMIEAADMKVLDPELNSGFLSAVREDVPAAIVEMHVAIDARGAKLEEELAAAVDAADREAIQLQGDLDLAGLHFILGSLLSQQPAKAEQDRVNAWFEEMQKADPNSTETPAFPEPTAEEKATEDQQRTEALAAFETSQRLDNQSPHTPLRIAEMLVQLEKKDRYPEALSLIKGGLEFGSRDLQTQQDAQRLVTSLKDGFDPVTQTDLVAQAETLLATITTTVTTIQTAHTEWQKQQEDDLNALRGLPPTETPAEGEVPVEGAPPAEGTPIEITLPEGAPAEGTPIGVLPADPPTEEAPAAPSEPVAPAEPPAEAPATPPAGE